MSQKGIDHLIINSPFEEPKKLGLYIRETQEFELKEERRKAGSAQACWQSPENKI